MRLLFGSNEFWVSRRSVLIAVLDSIKFLGSLKYIGLLCNVLLHRLKGNFHKQICCLIEILALFSSVTFVSAHLAQELVRMAQQGNPTHRVGFPELDHWWALQ